MATWSINRDTEHVLNKKDQHNTAWLIIIVGNVYHS